MIAAPARASSRPDLRTERFAPSRPLRSAALLLAPAPLPIALWAFGVLPAAAALGFGASLVLLALAQGAFGAYDLHRSRRLGDRLLRAYPGGQPISGLAAWRAAELTSARNRGDVARLVRQLRRETETCIRLGTPRVDRAAVDEALVLLRRLERRLETFTEPVSPVGMLDVLALVSSQPGPLHAPGASGRPARGARPSTGRSRIK